MTVALNQEANASKCLILQRKSCIGVNELIAWLAGWLCVPRFDDI